MGQLSKSEIYYIINHYIDTRKLLKSLGISVRANNAMFCPFHDNTETPAAHLYKEQDGSHTIYCYAEDHLYHNTDLYKYYMPNINFTDLATLLYNNLPEEEKLKIADNINKPYELPEIPYATALQDFAQRKITYKDLKDQINKTLPYDDMIRLINAIYAMGDSTTRNNMNSKYLYFMNNYKSDYRFISANKLLLNYGNSLPSFLVDFLKISGDSVMIPNKVNDTVYSLTFRNISGKIQFIKIGITSQLFYGIGTLPDNFIYGMPLVIVEGNIDCDSIRQLYPYTIATLTNTITLNQMRILACLTDKVVLAYDNDDPGKQGTVNTKRNLDKYGFKVRVLEHSISAKDFGDIIDYQMRGDRDTYEYLMGVYRRKLQTILDSM